MLRIALVLLAAPLLNAQFKIQPNQSGKQSFQLKNGTLDAEGQTLEQLLQFAYHLQAGAAIGPSWMSEKTFDVHGTTPPGEKVRPLLRKALIDYFNLAVKTETRPVDLYVLQASPDAEAKLASAGTPDNDSMSHIRGKNLSADSIARYLSTWLGKPVIDETGFKGKYTVDITWDANKTENLIPAVEHAGLRVKQDRRPYEVLVVTEN